MGAPARGRVILGRIPAPACARPPCALARRAGLVGLLVLAPGIGHGAEHAQRTDLQWHFEAVGTPGLAGPSAIGRPGYVAPAPVRLAKPIHVACDAQDAIGEFEATVTPQGTVEDVRSLRDPSEGTACQRRAILPAIRQWRFLAATFQGRAVSVLLRIRVDLP